MLLRLAKPIGLRHVLLAIGALAATFFVVRSSFAEDRPADEPLIDKEALFEASDGFILGEANILYMALNAAAGRPPEPGVLFPRGLDEQIRGAIDYCDKFPEIPAPISKTGVALFAAVVDVCGPFTADQDFRVPDATYPGEVHRPAKIESDTAVQARARGLAVRASRKIAPLLEAHRLYIEAALAP